MSNIRIVRNRFNAMNMAQKEKPIIPDTIKVHYDNNSMIDDKRKTKPIVHIVERSMFDHALMEYKNGKKVAIHNFANNYSPGLYRTKKDGTHYFVTNTQEEQLLRASLVDGKIYLPISMYPISKNYDNNKLDDNLTSSGLYTSHVYFHSDPIKGTQMPYSKHFYADVISCALLQYPDTKEGKYTNQAQEYETLKLMILVLNIARDADVFITGLWGCGAFMHPITEIIRLWRIALKIAKYHPKEVVFCYYPDTFTNIANKKEQSVSIMNQLLDI